MASTPRFRVLLLFDYGRCVPLSDDIFRLSKDCQLEKKFSYQMGNYLNVGDMPLTIERSDTKLQMHVYANSCTLKFNL